MIEKEWFDFATTPPDQGDSGNVEALFLPSDNPEGEPELKTLSLYHYADDRGSIWGHSVPSEKPYRWKTLHEKYLRWRYIGPPVPEKEEQNYIAVWAWDEAPGELRALSDHGGDEDWVFLVPEKAREPYWIDSESLGSCNSRHDLPDGRIVIICAHA